VRHLLRGTHAEDDRETLSGEGAEARERCHGRLGLSDAVRLVHRGIAAVQEEVPKGAVRVQVAAQDRLVVHFQFQEGGKDRHSFTTWKVEQGRITLSWHGVAWAAVAGSHFIAVSLLVDRGWGRGAQV